MTPGVDADFFLEDLCLADWAFHVSIVATSERSRGDFQSNHPSLLRRRAVAVDGLVCVEE